VKLYTQKKSFVKVSGERRQSPQVMPEARGLSPAAYSRIKAKRKNQRCSVIDSALASNTAYMHVIKESHESILRRKRLEQQK